MAKATEDTGMSETAQVAGRENKSVPGKKRRRRIWVLLLVLVLVLFFGVGFLAYYINRPKPSNRTHFPDYTDLAAQIPAIIKSRYPTHEEIRQFPVLWPRVKPEDNALGDYLNALSLLSLQAPPAGSALASSSETSYDGDVKAFGEWINANQPALNALGQAVQYNDFGLPVLLSVPDGTPVPALKFCTGMRQLARLCLDAGVYAELQGRPDDAVRWYMTPLRMGRHMRRGILLQNLVSIALTAMGSKAMCRLIANDGVSEYGLREIIAFCDDEPVVTEELAAVLDGEMEWYQAHPALQKTFAGILTGQSRSLRRVRRSFVLPLSQLLCDEDVRKRLSGRFPSSGMEGALWRWRSDVAIRQVRMAALKSYAALALFRNRHGEFPKKLEELVPDILPQVPLDPYTGRSLRYKQDGKTWQLRCTGPDTTFDDEETTPQQLRGNFWEGLQSVAVRDAESESGYSWKRRDFDYIMVSTLDSNINVRKEKHPKADAEWARLHPEQITRRFNEDRPGPPRE